MRGFDIRQVPLYIDGVPVYVPYDGYVDMDRFLTYDVSEVQVSKGFTSPLYGPNALGGAINLISAEPTAKLNLDLGAAFGSGGRRGGFINAGSRWRRVWFQGGYARTDSDGFPLTSGVLRDNSYQSDGRGRAKIAFTPRGRDVYSFGWVRQQGEKGNPPYLGTDPLVRLRFWQWPQWDKQSFYALTNTALPRNSYLRVRAYRDTFNNLLKSYDDARYNTKPAPPPSPALMTTTPLAAPSKPEPRPWNARPSRPRSTSRTTHTAREIWANRSAASATKTTRSDSRTPSACAGTGAPSSA